MSVYEKIFLSITEIIFWIFTIWASYMLLLKILGNSPADQQVLYVGFGIMMAYLLGFTWKAARFTGKVEEFMGVSKNTFKKVGEELREIRTEIRTEIGKTEAKLGGDISAVEYRLSEGMNAVEERLGRSINAVEERLGKGMNAVEERLSDDMRRIEIKLDAHFESRK